MAYRCATVLSDAGHGRQAKSVTVETLGQQLHSLSHPERDYTGPDSHAKSEKPATHVHGSGD